MNAVNRVLTGFFDLVMAPLDRLSPMAGLVVLSLVTAIGVLMAFKWTADQRALVAAKRAMQAAIFEMRLFNDDLAALFRAQVEVLRHTLTYLRLSIAPTLWLIVPMVALMLHMEYRFGYSGLRVGEAALVTARFVDSEMRAAGPADAGRGSAAPARLEAPEAIHVETSAVLLPSEREIAWRIRPSAVGSYELRVHMGGPSELLGGPGRAPRPRARAVRG